MRVLILVCFLLHQLAAVSRAQGECERQVFPVNISYRSDNFDHTVTDDCTPYPGDTPAPQNIDPTQYVRCRHPTVITDGNNAGPPFFIWGESSGHLLLEFETTINFSSIVIHYQYNETYARPKLSIYAVPDSFKVWDNPDSSFTSRVFDEVDPPVGGEIDELRQLPGTGDPTLQLVTSRVLIDKLEDTKTFLFAFSEVAFQEYCPEGTGTTTTTTMTTTAQPVPTRSTSTPVTTTTEPVSTTGENPFGGGSANIASSFLLAVMALTALLLTRTN